MAEKGAPVDPEKLQVVALRVSKQIQRADEIVRNMNGLAHSVDDFQKSVGLREILELSVRLAVRPADMRSVKLDLKLPHDSFSIITSPFHLLNLLWQVLDFSMGVTGDEKTVGITFEKVSHIVKIRFSGLDNLKDLPSEMFPTEKEEVLLRTLKARIRKKTDACEVCIELPSRYQSTRRKS